MHEIKFGIWSLGICGWLFGLSERGFSAIADNLLSANDLILLFTAAFFAVCWVFLLPSKQ
jgi:hypothetical protein